MIKKVDNLQLALLQVKADLNEVGIKCNADNLRSNLQTADFVFLRAVASYALLLRQYTRPQIGFIVNRDHSNIIHLLNTYQPRQSDLIEKYTQAKNNLLVLSKFTEKDRARAVLITQIETLQAQLAKLDARKGPKFESFYIQNGPGEDPIKWWDTTGNGYTIDIRKAGKYHRVRTKKIISVGVTDVAWPVEYIDSMIGAQRLTIDGRTLNGKKRVLPEDL